jgi:hypothetical protein
VPRRSQSLCLVMPAALGGSNTIAGRCLSEMPRYFFQVRRGDVTVFDREGVELTGIAEAKPRGGGREVTARDAEISASLGAGRIIIEEGWRTVLELPF